MDLKNTLLAYSEWLDGEHLIKGDSGDDNRSHGELVEQFVKEWGEREGAQPLIGEDEPKANLGYATTINLANELLTRASVALSVGEEWPAYRTVDS